jgi:Amt family ammonium transporter
LLTGILAQRAWGSPADGLLFGNPAQLGVQALAVAAALSCSALVTAGILWIGGAVVPLRAADRDEALGLDVSQHGEEAYAREDGAILILPDARTAQLVPHTGLAPTLTLQGD